MGEQTAISWTDHTFNTWIGCEHAPNPDGTTAPECDNCYAEATDHRFHAGKHWGPGSTRTMMSDEYWRKPLLWDKRAAKDGVRRRVFCASQSDVFERTGVDWLDFDLDKERSRLWRLILDTPNLDWLLLTKRPENAARMLPWIDGSPNHAHVELSERHGRLITGNEPWPNVWLGTTCGVRASLHRIKILRSIPAAVRFVSCEPILEHITAEDWDRVLSPDITPHMSIEDTRPIHWLIVGDESGRKRRPAEDEWIRTARDAAERHGVAFHLKQRHGADGKRVHLPVLDGRQWSEFPR